MKLVSNTILTIAVIGLLVFAGVQAIELANIKAAITGGATANSGGINTAGWTADEIMNYEMHGIIPARAGGGSSSPSTAMVGGC